MSFQSMAEELRKTNDALNGMERQRDEARAVAEDFCRRYNQLLEEKRRVTCVFCGHEYAEGTPASQDQALADHIQVCEKHPLREARARIQELEAELACLKGLCRNILHTDRNKDMERRVAETEVYLDKLGHLLGLEGYTNLFDAVTNLLDRAKADRKAKHEAWHELVQAQDRVKALEAELEAERHAKYRALSIAVDYAEIAGMKRVTEPKETP